MKDKIIILANLQQKIALWRSGFTKEIKLKEHIEMLDWVFVEGDCRTVEEIVVDERYDKIPEEFFS